MHDERLGDELEHRHARVQARVRVLEHELHVTPELAQVLAGRGGDVVTTEADRARERVDPTQDGPPGRGLAGSALADETERLALGDRERHLVDGVDVADVLAPEAGAADGEADAQVVDLDEGTSRYQARVTSNGRQHATLRPLSNVFSPGIASRHCVTASEHRAA